MKFRILLSFILFSLFCKGQDPLYDMSYENRLLLNPAFCGGNGEGVVRTSLFHHNIFRPIRGPFNNSSASIDYLFCEPKIAVGLIVQNENQGDGLLMMNSLSPVFSKPIQLRENLLVSFGMQADFIYQSIDWNKLIFSDQIDPVLGVVKPSSNSNVTINNQTAYGISAGLNLIGKSKYHQFRIPFKWDLIPFKWNFGISANHIKSSSFGLLSDTYIIPIRLTLHGGLIFEKYVSDISESFEFTMRYDIQPIIGSQGLNNTVMANLGYYFNSAFSMGLGVRPNIFTNEPLKNTHSIVVSTGIIPPKTDKLKINLSYSFSVSGLGFANTFEIGLIFFSPDHCKSKGSLLCPKIFEKGNKMNLVF